jgi:hypothetical protein
VNAASLASQYERVVEHSRAGDVKAAHAAFLRVVGLRAYREAAEIPSRPLVATAPLVRYRAPRRVDRLALASGARDVAKFEDLSHDGADRLEAELLALGLSCVRVGPYEKRFDVVVTSPGASEPLYSVIASRGELAERVAAAERDRTPEGTRRAGLALGYPACCVDHFVEVERSPRAQAEGINEAAVRSTGHLDEEAPWELNPLSTLSPVGFTPCSMRCAPALAFARRVLAGVQELDPAGFEIVRRTLLRPVVFFRYPMFFVLDEAKLNGRVVRYARAVANGDDRFRLSALAAWQQFELAEPLSRANIVDLAPSALELRRDDGVVARWELETPQVPLLLRFG